MIVFNGKTSDEMHLLVQPFSLRQRAGRGSNTYNIPGRPEPYIETEEFFDPVTVRIECDLMDCAEIDDIFEWLSGTGILLDSRHPDKYRIAQIPDEIGVTAVNDEIVSLTIPFICSAFMYSVDNEPVEFTSSPANIAVGGSYYCEPIYELHFKTGTTAQKLDFSVNGQTVSVNLTDEHLQHILVLDSTSQKIYYKDNYTLIMPDTSGSVPYMNYGGSNVVEWSGDILEKVVITKNERWL